MVMERRGFLAGCLAVLAAPLSVLDFREKPTVLYLNNNEDWPLTEIRIFRSRLEVVTNGKQWDLKITDGQWKFFTFGTSNEWNKEGLNGQIRLRRVDDKTVDIDHFVFCSPYRHLHITPYSATPSSPAENLQCVDRLMNKLYRKLQAQV